LLFKTPNLKALSLSTLGEISSAIACAGLSLDDHPENPATHRLILVGLTLALSSQVGRTAFDTKIGHRRFGLSDYLLFRSASYSAYFEFRA
jgi:hypothetical protein